MYYIRWHYAFTCIEDNVFWEVFNVLLRRKFFRKYLLSTIYWQFDEADWITGWYHYIILAIANISKSGHRLMASCVLHVLAFESGGVECLQCNSSKWYNGSGCSLGA